MSCANLFSAIIQSAESKMTQINLNGLSVKQSKSINYVLPLDSISLMHISTTIGLLVKCAFTSVVRSQLYTFLTCFRSGLQSFGTILEHCLCTFKPQSERKTKQWLGWCLVKMHLEVSTEGYVCTAPAGCDLISQPWLLVRTLNRQMREAGIDLK